MSIRGCILLFNLCLTAASFLVACSSSTSADDSTSGKPDGGAPNDAAIQEAGEAGETTYKTLRLLALNNICAPSPLPTDDAGEIDCRVIVVLQGAASCGVAGLTDAPSADVAGVEAEAESEGISIPPSQFCLLDQIPGGGDCYDSQTPGWCYFAGSCKADGGCAQQLCTNAGYDAGSQFLGAWLACP